MAKKTVQIKKPVVSRRELADAIRKRLESIDIPKQMYLEKWEQIIDVKKFFETHLSIVERHEGKSSEPYAYRLKKALKLLDIDINEIAKSLIDKKK